ncbi:MAG: hypothetical protein JNL08_15505 [Planctomycetes bacterium]|nr:hypothetical protein [Planctomycetota bacterium]
MSKVGMLVALLAVASASAQEPPPAPTPSCRSCADRGTLPCGKHGKDLGPEADAAVRLCSVAAECKACGGALAVDCRSCRNGPAEQALAARQQLVHDWLEQRRKAVDDTLGERSLLHLETTHCDLVFGLRALTVGKQKLDPHALMHLYGQRIESLREDFRTLFELTDADLPGRLRVYMFRDQKHHGVIGPRETGLGSASSIGLKQMGPEFVYSMWHDQRSLAADDALHRNIVHNVAHLLLSQMLPVQWIGNRSHGWIDEGLAHWFEDRTNGKCTNYCYEEILTMPGAGWKNGVWRPHVRKLLEDGGLPTFAQLSTRNTDQLTFPEHAAAFAWVDHLLTAHGGARFRDLVRALKAGQATRDALQAVYQLNPLTIEAPFQAWLREHYPLPH